MKIKHACGLLVVLLLSFAFAAYSAQAESAALELIEVDKGQRGSSADALLEENATLQSFN